MKHWAQLVTTTVLTVLLAGCPAADDEKHHLQKPSPHDDLDLPHATDGGLSRVRPFGAQDGFPCGSLVFLVGPRQQGINIALEWNGLRDSFKELLLDPSQKNGFCLDDLHGDRKRATDRPDSFLQDGLEELPLAKAISWLTGGMYSNAVAPDEEASSER